jgi:hypothetical protein
MIFSTISIYSQKLESCYICKGWITGYHNVKLFNDSTFHYQIATDYGMSVSYEGDWLERIDTLVLMTDRKRIKDISGFFTGNDTVFFDTNGFLLELDIQEIDSVNRLEYNLLLNQLVKDRFHFLIRRNKIFKILDNNHLSEIGCKKHKCRLEQE